MVRRVDISHKTIFFIAGFIATLWILFQIRDVIILFFTAIILMSALSPVVGFMEKTKIPRSLAIALTYIIIIACIIGLIYLVTVPLFEQTANLLQTLPQNIDKLIPADGPIDRSFLQQELTTFSKNALGSLLTVFNNIIAFISVAVLTFYLILEKERLDKLVSHLFVGKEEQALNVTRKIEDKLGAWMRGQLSLSLIISVLVYAVLFLLGIPYALPLAILAGILEVVPVIGPIISAIPAILVAYLLSPVMALIVGVAFFIIQQLENNFIVPQVMKRAVGLNPLVVILAIAIGGKLLGISGALLAVPIAVVVQVLFEDVIRGGVNNTPSE